MKALFKKIFNLLFPSDTPTPTPAPSPVAAVNRPTVASLEPIEEFQLLLDREKIKHFTAKELFFRGNSDKKLQLNTDPPKKYWNNMIETVKVADAARELLGRPLRVNSAYRSPAYNRAIKGSTNSQHLYFRALDLSTTAPKSLAKALNDLRSQGVFKGGIGVYKSFVHLDTRGTNANW
jgi:hypothetical protein